MISSLSPAAVPADERDDLVQDPRLVELVAARALLEWDAAVRPRLGVERIDAVELHAPGGEQVADRPDHPVALEVAGVAALGREREDRAGGRARIPVDRDAVHGASRRNPVRGRFSLPCAWPDSARSASLGPSNPVRTGCVASWLGPLGIRPRQDRAGHESSGGMPRSGPHRSASSRVRWGSNASRHEV